MMVGPRKGPRQPLWHRQGNGVSGKLQAGEQRSTPLVAPKFSMVSASGFRLSAKEAEIYTLVISEMDRSDATGVTEGLDSIPKEYHDLHEVFSEKSSNELPDHGTSDMKIEFKDGQEPRNSGLRPMSPVELEELRGYLEENLGKG